MEAAKEKVCAWGKQACGWLMSDAHRAKMGMVARECIRAFVEHPKATGETYWQHLWFTSSMAARFFYVGTVITVHGLFPFIWKTTASSEIEKIYRIMKSRIPKARRQEIDAAYELDYCV